MGYYGAFNSSQMDNPASTTGGGFDFQSLLQNKNFLQLLAGIGARMDPKGAGGIIGVPAAQLIASQAVQERADKVAADKSMQENKHMAVIQQLGGLTDKGLPGVTSATKTPTGLKLDLDLHPAPVSNTNSEPANAGSVAPAASTPSSPTPANIADTVGTLTTPTAVANNTSYDPKKGILSSLPFYSALLRA